MWIWASKSTNLKGLTDSEFNQGIVKDSDLTSNYVNTALKELSETLDRGNVAQEYDPNKTYNAGDIVQVLCVKSGYGAVLYEVRYFIALRTVGGVSPFGSNATFTEINGIKIYNEASMDLWGKREGNMNDRSWAHIWNN